MKGYSDKDHGDRSGTKASAEHGYESAVKSPWAWGIGAIIATAFSVNIFLVYVAVTTSPGLVSEDYYERGKSFATRAKLKDEETRKHNWKLSIESPSKNESRNPATFILKASAATGVSLVAAEAKLYAYRPSDSAADFSVILKPMGAGEYGAEVEFPLPGAWDVIAEIDYGGHKIDAAKRLLIAETPD